MSVCATAKRRRRQAVQGYRHIAKLGRPIYKTKSLAKLDRRAQVSEERRKALMNRKKVRA